MKVLVIAPHPDDEVLGVGGTIAKRVAAGDEVYVCIATKGFRPMFNPELIEKGREEAMIAHTFLGVKYCYFLDFPAAELDAIPMARIIHAFERLIQEVQPDEIFIPHKGDIHHDHKIIVDAAMVALRPKYPHKVKRVYSYEVPSETGWDLPIVENAFIPNVFEDIRDTLILKLEALRTYQSQAEAWPGARSVRAVEYLARYRGSTVCIPAAEAFSLVREIR